MGYRCNRCGTFYGQDMSQGPYGNPNLSNEEKFICNDSGQSAFCGGKLVKYDENDPDAILTPDATPYSNIRNGVAYVGSGEEKSRKYWESIGHVIMPEPSEIINGKSKGNIPNN